MRKLMNFLQGVLRLRITGTFPERLLNLAICYANGYDRYIADTAAYDAGYYEALAAVLARGEGEKLMKTIQTMLQRERSTPL